MTINSKTIGYILLTISLLFIITYFIQSWFGEVSSPNGAWLMGFMSMVAGGVILFRGELNEEGE